MCRGRVAALRGRASASSRRNEVSRKRRGATHFVLRPVGAGDGSDRVLGCVESRCRRLGRGGRPQPSIHEVPEKFLTPLETGADSMRLWRLPSGLPKRLRLPSSASGDETRSRDDTNDVLRARGWPLVWFIFVGRGCGPRQSRTEGPPQGF